MAVTIERNNEIAAYSPSLTNLNQEAKFLLRQFLETREADEVWEPIKKTICAGGNIDPWQPDIFPNIFERLSFLYFYPVLKDKNYVLLAPYETNFIYKQLYNKEDTAQVHAFNPFSYGITKPDGLIVAPGKRVTQLVGVLEATTCIKIETNEQKQTQLRQLLNKEAVAANLEIPQTPYCYNPHAVSYELGELLHSLRPKEIPNLPVGMAKGWEVILACPPNTSCDLPVKKAELPLSYSQFADFAYNWLTKNLEQVFPEGWAI